MQANPTTLWGDPGAMWDRVGLRSRMCSARTVRSSRQPASCLTILPPRTERSVVSLAPRSAAFGGRSIRMELYLNGRRQVWVRVLLGGAYRGAPCVSTLRDHAGLQVDHAPCRVAVPTGQVEPESYPKGHLMEFGRSSPVPTCCPQWMWISGVMRTRRRLPGHRLARAIRLAVQRPPEPRG